MTTARRRGLLWSAVTGRFVPWRAKPAPRGVAVQVAGGNHHDHEHVFAEEQEPAGRLILGPCLVCGLSALDGMAAVVAERDEARRELDQSGG